MIDPKGIKFVDFFKNIVEEGMHKEFINKYDKMDFENVKYMLEDIL